MSNYIFLDIDGVLNDIRYTIKTIDKNKRILGKNYSAEIPFNPRSLKNLQKLVAATKAEIILSSTWRLNEIERRVVGSRLGEYGLLIKDITTCEYKDRGLQIREWLDEHWNSAYDNYIIIDDDSFDILPYFDEYNFVRTNGDFGFTNAKRREAIFKLKYRQN